MYKFVNHEFMYIFCFIFLFVFHINLLENLSECMHEYQI